MNRGQQQQQRPPNLPQVPTTMQYSRAGGAGYPTSYPIPPRGTLPQQNYPTLQSRTPQNILPQTPAFMQRGGTGSYFGSNSGMNLPMQTSSHSNLPSLQNPSQTSLNLQQPQTSLHLGGAVQQATGTSSSSENVIDQSDFPPLGSTTAPQSNNGNATGSGQLGGGTFHSTYASQAGTAIGSTVAPPISANAPQRDLQHDDFPPLGSQPSSQHSQATQEVGNGQGGHANGFGSQPQQPSSQSQDQARTLLMAGQQPGISQPGSNNLQPQRNLQNLQSELDKRNFSKMAAAGQIPWSAQQSTNAQVFSSGLSNGQLGGPPNLPAPSSFNGQSYPQQPQQPPSLQIPQLGAGQDASSLSRQTGQAAGQQLSSVSSSNPAVALPQTPAQQILLSPADRWGLLSLLANIKGTDPDAQLLGSGTDLARIGLDLTSSGRLSSHFITPWTDSSTAQVVEPEFHLPACYNVQAPAPGPQKVSSFSDETLFFMFYSSPRDTLQEIAAQELYNRNWRYHKNARMWLTKESGHSPAQKDATGERGTYTFFDPERWEKVKKEAVIYYDHLEERALPQQLSAMNLNLAAMPMGGHGMGLPMANQQPQQIPMRG